MPKNHHEDMQTSLTAFADFLKTTNDGENIDCIEYHRTVHPVHTDWVQEDAIIFYKDDVKKPVTVSINGDSAIEAAKDIIKALNL